MRDCFTWPEKLAHFLPVATATALLGTVCDVEQTNIFPGSICSTDDMLSLSLLPCNRTAATARLGNGTA